MPAKLYILPEERDQIREDAAKQAADSVGGPAGIYETSPGEDPVLVFKNEGSKTKRLLCALVWEDETRKETCHNDHKNQAAELGKAEIAVCWCGVHNAVCPVRTDKGSSVVVTGGGYCVVERRTEAEGKLEKFLETIPSAKREAFREAWHQLPEISEAELLGDKMRELEASGQRYLYSLNQRSEFWYMADQATHDLAITVQALIADIEVLKIEMKEAFNIGRKWEDRFEALINVCMEQYSYLEWKLRLDQPKYAYCSINKIVRENVDQYVAKAKKKGIDIQVDLERDIDESGKHKVITVYADALSLRQAFHNVIDNAVKYSFSGAANHPGRIEIGGRLKSLRGKPGYCVTVSNFGIGIEADELKLVFEPGYQGKRRLGENRTGFGMGLTFVKNCVEKQHGGEVVIESRPASKSGWVTIVTIWLPLEGPKAFS